MFTSLKSNLLPQLIVASHVVPRVVLACLFLCAIAPSALAQVSFTGIQTTVGTGFNYPFGAAVDGNGNVYVADFSGNEVKEILAVNGRIPASPTINVLGSGFKTPGGVAVDAFGNVFVADTGNSLIKEILAVNGVIPSTNPTINVVASSASWDHPEGIAVDVNGNLYIAGDYSGEIDEILAVGGSIPANNPTTRVLASSLGNPSGVAVDASGNVYLADYDNKEVKEILAVGGVIPSSNPTINVLGSGFGNPSGVAVDASGNVYVADFGNSTVKEILAVNGSIPANNPTIVSLGTSWGDPFGVAVDTHGNVFVADAGYNEATELQLRSVNFGSQALGSTSADISLPFSIGAGTTVGSFAALTNGSTNLDFNIDNFTCSAKTYTAAATCQINVKFAPTVAGSRQGALVFFSGTGNTGTVLATVPLYGVGTGSQTAFYPSAATALAPTVNSLSLTGPAAAVVDGSGNIYIADSGNSRVLKIPAGNGTPVAIDPTVNATSLYGPRGLAVDSSGNLFIADTNNGRVIEVPVGGGAAIAIAPVVDDTALSLPYGLAVDGSGNLFIADYANNRVLEVPPGAAAATSISPVVNGVGLSGPVGVALDGAGDLFISDLLNNRVVEVPAVGAPTAIAPKVDGVIMQDPLGIAVDAAGDLYIAELSNNIVVELPTGGQPFAFSSPASPQGWSEPFGLALDSKGNLLVADYGNNRVAYLPRAQTPTLAFPTATLVGTTDTEDGAMTVELFNIGNQAMSVSSLTVPSDFTMLTSGDTADCTTSESLAPGQECDLNIEFAPKTVGSLSQQLIIDENSASSYPTVASVTLKGTGVTLPTVKLSASALSFASTDTGAMSASQSVTLTNTGGSALSITSIDVTGTDASSFVFANSCGTSLAAGANCSIHGHFAPVAGGALTAAITIKDNAANSPQTVTLTGTGIAVPAVKLSATSLSFGPVDVGAVSGSQTVTVTNSGAATLTISSISVTGLYQSSFVFANSCGTTLAAGANCTIHGHFGPTVAGNLTGTISIADNASGSPQSITLKGTGLGTLTLSATNLSFGSVAVGAATGSQTVTMTNTSANALSITGITVTGANASSFDFANSCGTSLAAGANCTIHGHFQPTEGGALTATINIADGIAGSPQHISLSGTGLGPAVSLSATSLAFGTETVGMSSGSQSVTMTNTGTAALSITSITVTGTDASSWVFANSCGTSLAAGANCAIHGHFAPAATGALTAAITIKDSAAGSPQTIALTGTGQ